MQAYVLNGFGDGGGIDLVEAPTPTLGPRDVLMRVRAASVNYRDVMIQRGSYPVPASVDTVPLSDGAGEVAAIGPEVTRFVVGDRVAAAYFPKWTAGRLTLPQAMVQPGASRDGMLAEYYAADEAAFVGIPQHLSFEEASTLPCAAVTAWSAVNGHRPIIPGETVLVVGGGSVALFAIQFAARFGARVIAVSSKPEKVPLLSRLGATEVIVSADTPEWDRRVMEITAGRGAEHVVEAVGPATLARSIRSAAFDAEIALMGIFAGEQGFDGSALAGRLVTIRRVVVGSRGDFEAMNLAIGFHKLRPIIGDVLAFTEARDAYRRFSDSPHTGKIVIAGAT